MVCVQDSSYIQQLSIPMTGLTLKTRVFAAVRASNLDRRYLSTNNHVVWVKHQQTMIQISKSLHVVKNHLTSATFPSVFPKILRTTGVSCEDVSSVCFLPSHSSHIIDGIFWWTTATPLPLETQMTTCAMISSLGNSSMKTELWFWSAVVLFLFSCICFLTPLLLLGAAVKKTPRPPSLKTGRARWVVSRLKSSALWSTRTRRCPRSFCTVSLSCAARTTVPCSCQWDHQDVFILNRTEFTASPWHTSQTPRYEGNVEKS